LKRLRPSLGCLWFGASIRAGRPFGVYGIDTLPLDRRTAVPP
jgi:hypothetical protein